MSHTEGTQEVAHCLLFWHHVGFKLPMQARSDVHTTPRTSLTQQPLYLAFDFTPADATTSTHFVPTRYDTTLQMISGTLLAACGSLPCGPPREVWACEEDS